MRFSEYLRAVEAGRPPRVSDATIPGQVGRFQGRPAGLMTRLIAIAVDLALVYVLVRALELTLRVIDLVATPWITVPTPTPDVLLGIGFVIFWAYATWSWRWAGRTFGEYLMGIRVATEAGEGLGARRAALRSLLLMAFPPGLLWVPWDRRGRALQDVLLRTCTNYDWLTGQAPTAMGSALPSEPGQARAPGR